MKYRKLYLVPIGLLLIAIISSIFSFVYTKKIDDGYIYMNDHSYNVAYEGEYIAILGNLGYDSYYITFDNNNEGFIIQTLDGLSNVIGEFKVTITEEESGELIELSTEFSKDQLVIIDELDGYPFTVNLEKNKNYQFSIEIITGTELSEIDIVLANIPLEYYNLKGITESVSYTTAVFSLISMITISILIRTSKNN